MGKLIPNPAPPLPSPPPVAGDGIAVTSTAAGAEISNTGVLSVNNKTGDVTLPTAALPSTYELAPYHGAYPNVLYSPFYLIPSRVGGIYINSTNATVDGASYPYSVAITPDGKYAYVVNTFNNNVLVIDVSTNTAITTVNVGSDPNGIAITPDGKYAYVVNGDSNGSVSVIDISTNTVTATVSVGTVGTSPIGIAITPDGKYAYVTNGGNNNVSIIDISTNTVLETVGVGSAPIGVAITPDGKYAYVTNRNSDNVSVIETAVPEYDIQDLTEQTSTATTAPGLSIGSITFTAGYTGTVYLEAIVRGSNNTVGDGITVGLYNGTTLLDSETYTQEGAASNQHTFSLFYALSVSLGSTYTIHAYILAVTGGTAQAKLVRLKARDQY